MKLPLWAVQFQQLLNADLKVMFEFDELSQDQRYEVSVFEKRSGNHYHFSGNSLDEAMNKAFQLLLPQG